MQYMNTLEQAMRVKKDKNKQTRNDDYQQQRQHPPKVVDYGQENMMTAESKDTLSLSKFVASDGIGGTVDDSKTPDVKGLALPEWSILQVEPLPASLRDHTAQQKLEEE